MVTSLDLFFQPLFVSYRGLLVHICCCLRRCPNRRVGHQVAARVAGGRSPVRVSSRRKEMPRWDREKSAETNAEHYAYRSFCLEGKTASMPPSQTLLCSLGYLSVSEHAYSCQHLSLGFVPPSALLCWLCRRARKTHQLYISMRHMSPVHRVQRQQQLLQKRAQEQQQLVRRLLQLQKQRQKRRIPSSYCSGSCSRSHSPHTTPRAVQPSGGLQVPP